MSVTHQLCRRALSDVRGARLTWLWNDSELTELECLVDTGDFRGRSTCYSGLNDAATFGRELSVFLETCEGNACFSSAMAGDIKAVVLEVLPVDAAKHLAMRVHLATDGPPTEVTRLGHRFAVEPWALERFARQLRALRNAGDEAHLALESPF